MLLHGDELGRTQGGNNNVYAQDSELSWVDWATADKALIEFTAALIKLRREHPTFRRARFFDGRPVKRGAQGDPWPDLEWLRPSGELMEPEDWEAGFGQAIGMFLNGQGIHGRGPRGERVVDRSFLVYFSAAADDVEVVLPDALTGVQWDVVVDTSLTDVDGPPLEAGDKLTLTAHSLVVLREHVAPDTGDAAVSVTLASTGTELP
jgi:isoamylase